MVEVRYDRGVFLPEAGLWLDPRDSRDMAFVSHAHSDHVGRHKRVIASVQTLSVMQARMGAMRGEPVSLRFGEVHSLGSCSIRLLHAGHVLGSAQAFVETPGGTLLYTGDFKLRHGLSSKAAEHCHAETLIMETTYGLPRYVFPPREEVAERLLQFCRGALSNGDVPVLLAYSFGKAQEVLATLAGSGMTAMVHTSIERLLPYYISEGVEMAPCCKLEAHKAAGHVVICPPSVVGSSAVSAINRRRVAVVSGWALDSSLVHRRRCDAAFPLSDHAGFDDLLRMVELVKPKRVYTLHGFSSEFAEELRFRGVDALALNGANQLVLPLSSN